MEGGRKGEREREMEREREAPLGFPYLLQVVGEVYEVERRARVGNHQQHLDRN